MGKRRLKRQLNLVQIVMLGTAGTIGAQIFVLTGHAAAIVGPGLVIALLAGGLLSYCIALNYGELATTFPFTGGALTYVREAYGTNLLSFLVGALDCLSSTFYAALSAVGFAYSLQLFVPALPIVPTAIVTVLVFVVLNILGVSNLGNVQIVLGGLLLAGLLAYVVAGFVSPLGFHWSIFAPGGSILIHKGLWANTSKTMATAALVYVAYVGFEVIADDAEEMQNPGRNIPAGILLSLTLCMGIYMLVAMVTLGTVPWQQLAGSDTALSDTALSDAARRFMPGVGVPLLGVTGIVATLTSLNTAMLSATREAFTMSRDGMLPRALSRLSRFRTPYVSILTVGAIVCLVAAIGLVDFLSYISSSGYLFVLFWASLAMIRLRKLYPDVKRPFHVPFFPLTAYLAMATCFFLIAFTATRALLFGAGLLALLTLLYYAAPPIARLVAARVRAIEPTKDRVLVPVANPRTAESLVHLAAILAQASEDTSVCVLTVASSAPGMPQGVASRLSSRLAPRQRVLLRHLIMEAEARNVPLYTKLRVYSSVSSGVLEEVESSGDVKLVLLGWPGPLDLGRLPENPVKVLLQRARTNVAVLLDRGLQGIRQVLVPVGGGPHSRLALRLAFEIAEQEGAEITALYCHCGEQSVDALQDSMALLREIIEDELGQIPGRIHTRVACVENVPSGILAEAARQPTDLIVLGASEEWASQTRLFGSVDDWIVDKVKCSVLLVRRHEPAVIAWMRRRTKNAENGGFSAQPSTRPPAQPAG